MDIEKYKQIVYDLHLRAFDRRPDNKAVVFWAHALHSGEKTELDLVSFVIKSVEYHSRVLVKFRSVWLEIVGYEFDERLFESFFETTRDDFKIVIEDDIIEFIKKSDQYASKVTGLVTTLFLSRHNRFPTSQELELYLSKFLGPDEYTITMLESDMNVNNNIQPPIKSKERVLVDTVYKDKTEDEREELATLLSRLKNDDHALLDVLCAPQKQTPMYVDYDFLTAFETQFGRPIYIQEYVKYFENRKHLNLEDLKKTHNHRYHEIHNTLEKYLTQSLTEHEFVKDYLFKMDDPEFVSTFNKNIVYDSTYMSLMSDNIAKRYTELYDEQLEIVDIAYIFERVQVAHLELNDIRLDDNLMAFKAETDEIIKRVYKLYMDIYERAPDRNELLETFNSYRTASRSKVKFEEIDKHIEKELMACMEFHDIIKKRIKVQKKDISVSNLFKVLSRVLDEIGDIGISQLDDHIKTHFL